MNAADVIREMRNILFERGWYQGSYQGDDGSVCLIGAFNCATFGTAVTRLGASALSAVSEREARAAWRALCDATDDNPAGFNDQCAESFDDILSALDRAEKLAEQREAVS